MRILLQRFVSYNNVLYPRSEDMGSWRKLQRWDKVEWVNRYVKRKLYWKKSNDLKDS